MSTFNNQRRVALITGANKGLGFHVASQLAHADPNLTLLIGSRDVARGAEAVKKIGLPNVEAISLEVTSVDSVKQAAADIKSRFGGLDVLCNNAGVHTGAEDSVQGTSKAFDLTFDANYHSIINVDKHFTPILRANARVVNVASQLGPIALAGLPDATRKRFNSQTTIEGLNALVAEFRASFVASTAEADGWETSGYIVVPDAAKPKAATPYGISKLAVIAASKIFAKQVTNGVTVASACPGWCRTDMGSEAAPLSAEEGSARITYVVTRPEPEKSNGAFFVDRAVFAWE